MPLVGPGSALSAGLNFVQVSQYIVRGPIRREAASFVPGLFACYRIVSLAHLIVNIMRANAKPVTAMFIIRGIACVASMSFALRNAAKRITSKYSVRNAKLPCKGDVLVAVSHFRHDAETQNTVVQLASSELTEPAWCKGRSESKEQIKLSFN